MLGHMGKDALYIDEHLSKFSSFFKNTKKSSLVTDFSRDKKCFKNNEIRKNEIKIKLYLCIRILKRRRINGWKEIIFKRRIRTVQKICRNA